MNIRCDKVIVYVVRPPAEGGRGHELLQMLRRPETYLGGTWQFCSGGIEPGETAAQAAMRELREETGLVPRRLTFLSHVETFYIPSTDTLWHRVGFCAVVERNAVIQLNEEHTAFRWIARDEIGRRVTWPGERQALAEIFREHLRDSLSLPFRTIELQERRSAP